MSGSILLSILYIYFNISNESRVYFKKTIWTLMSTSNKYERNNNKYKYGNKWYSQTNPYLGGMSASCKSITITTKPE